jgi:PadR family transcriptional regulator, regulatory protein PadR
MLGKDLVAASARPLILSVLAQGENYGYAIIQQVRKLSAGRINWTDGMLYPVLHRLERQGLVKARWRVAESGRKRKYYRLNDKGAAALQSEREQWLAVHTTLADLWRIVPC